jgi:hypothetical protein
LVVSGETSLSRITAERSWIAEALMSPWTISLAAIGS